MTLLAGLGVPMKGLGNKKEVSCPKTVITIIINTCMFIKSIYYLKARANKMTRNRKEASYLKTVITMFIITTFPLS